MRGCSGTTLLFGDRAPGAGGGGDTGSPPDDPAVVSLRRKGLFMVWFMADMAAKAWA